MKLLTIVFLLAVLICMGFSCDTELRVINLATEMSKKYDVKKRDYVVIIDYSKSILSERLYVVDMAKKRIVISSRVSHAYNSGLIHATDFSNVPGSEKSSLGAYITGGTKYGKFGYSMYVRGLESQNSNAYSRNIIFHSNKKMDFAWSAGCFATPEETNRHIIDLVKGGTLVYVFR